MGWYDVTFQALTVRVQADSEEEAQQSAQNFVDPRSIKIFGSAPKVSSVAVADQPVGAGSEAE